MTVSTTSVADSNGNGAPRPAEELWRHPDPESTPMWQFLQHVNRKYGLRLDGYPALYRWSVEHVGPFWEEVWHYVGITASVPFERVGTFMAISQKLI